MEFRAVIFDFDGTLASLSIDFAKMRLSVAALAEAFLGGPPEPSRLPVLEWLEELASEVSGLDRAQGLELRSRGLLTITAMEMDAAREGRLFAFTRPMLRDLRRSGVPTAVITRNCTAAVRRVFPEITDNCDVFLAREDVARVKPHPGHALEALQRMGIGPDGVLLVGDHPMDVETARRAGLVAGAVASGGSDLETLSHAIPDFLAEDCGALMRQLGLWTGENS